MSLNIEQIEYKNYGNCLAISDGNVEVIVSIDFGPRILSFSLANGENILFNDINRTYQSEVYVKNNKSQFNEPCYAYGGHRMCAYPLTPNSFYPDNQCVMYSVEDDRTINFSSPAFDEIGLSFSMSLLFGSNVSDIMLMHNITNISDEEVLVGIASKTMFDAKGAFILPQKPVKISENEDSLLTPNRSFSFWEYTDIHDDRLFWGNNFITMTGETSKHTKIKFGMNSCQGSAMYKYNDNVFLLNYAQNDDAMYSDLNSSMEVYTDGNTMQLSTFSPTYDLVPHENICHIENWSIYSTNKDINVKDESEITDFVNTVGE